MCEMEELAWRPVRELVEFYIGGGWGNEQKSSSSDEQVAVIRGADFPNVSHGDAKGIPVRWEPKKKIAKRRLQDGDLVLEVSGGTKDRPTGRSVYISSGILSQHNTSTIPASFCRLIRPDRSVVDPLYLSYWLNDMLVQGRTWGYQVQSTGLANFHVETFLDREIVRVPSLEEQRRIAGVLGAFDDLIETNMGVIDQLSMLMGAIYRVECSRADERQPLDSLVASAVRGVTPKYTNDSESSWVLNQKCIRDGKVTLEPSRKMSPKKVDEKKMALPGDALVNSTGVGTLGRAARWMGNEPICVDSHVTVVKARDTRLSAWVARILIEEQMDIEVLGHGSTGQTELSSSRLLSLQVPLVDASHLRLVSGQLDGLDRAVAALQAESADLRRTRDELLPLLMSGRVHVSDAEGAVP